MPAPCQHRARRFAPHRLIRLIARTCTEPIVAYETIGSTFSTQQGIHAVAVLAFFGQSLILRLIRSTPP